MFYKCFSVICIKQMTLKHFSNIFATVYFISDPRVRTALKRSQLVVRDLGVYLDSELSMKNHVSKIANACFYHI